MNAHGERNKTGMSMKANGLNEVFFATIVLGLNGYFIGNVNGNEGKLLQHRHICHIGLILFKRAAMYSFSC